MRRWRRCRTGRLVTSGDGNQVRLWNVQKQLTRHLLACSASALALATLPLPIWSPPLYRSRNGRNFMLGDTHSSTEHAWSPATCG